MGKDSAFYQLMDVRISGVMNGIVSDDEEYQQISRKSDEYSGRLAKMELPKEVQLLIDRYVSEQNALGSRYGMFSYLLGFSDLFFRHCAVCAFFSSSSLCTRSNSSLVTMGWRFLSTMMRSLRISLSLLRHLMVPRYVMSGETLFRNPTSIFSVVFSYSPALPPAKSFCSISTAFT